MRLWATRGAERLRQVEQAGEHRIAADRAAVWRALNDPAVLRRCIDGCKSMERRGEGVFAAVVKAKVGPLNATFNAVLRLADLQPPASYSIRVEAKGGPVGVGKGLAKVSLQADDGGTLLRYKASAQVSGRLAQIGSRLIDGAARKMAESFFAAFQAEMEVRE